MQITSTLLSDAIIFSRSQPGMVEALDNANHDSNLEFFEVVCRVMPVPGQPDKFFLRVIFQYTSIIAGVQPPHFFADLAPHEGGGFGVLRPQTAAATFPSR